MNSRTVEALIIKIIKKPSTKQEIEIKKLQKTSFPKITEKEANEDFYHPPSAQTVAYIGNKLVGWTGIHETEQNFVGKKIKLGGYGICTHPDYQGRGIASKMSKMAMDYLKRKRVDIAFLSVDPKNFASVRLHARNGFVPLLQKFSWTNSKGILKKDVGGMITPVNSIDLFNFVLKKKKTLYIGNGYW